MASILESNIVNYVCACGNQNSISKLYFCRYCLKLRCGYCVCSQVDSHFCCNCLENIPSNEAKFKKNRCNKCFDCPICQHSLTSRANTIQVVPTQVQRTPGGAAAASVGTSSSSTAGGDGKDAKELKPIARKMFYLICLACRWTSRDVGIPDQTVATGQWPEMEYAHSTRFSMLLEHFQNVVLQDKQEKQDLWRRKAPKQHKFGSLTDRTGLTASIARRQLGWSDKNSVKKITKEPTINSSVATEDVNDLPADIFTQPVNLSSITTLKQRLNNPSLQPYTVNNLYPQHKSLSIKRSVRCRQCEHYVIKPEYNPISIKYRIHLLASYLVPEIRLMKNYQIKRGESSQIRLKFINPTMHDTTIMITPLPTKEEEQDTIEELKLKFNKQISLSTAATSMPQISAGITGTNTTSTTATTTAATSSTSFGSNISFIALAPFVEVPKMVDRQLTGTVTLPDESFIVHHRDDSKDFDEYMQVPDDPKFLVWRRSNKVAIELTVNPLACDIGDDVIIGFTMQYNHLNAFTNTTSNVPEKKDPQEQLLSSRIYIKVGTVVE